MKEYYSDVLVSIVIPVFNGERYIEECLLSVLSQKHHFLEVIVVDDGSVDATKQIVLKIAAADSRVRYFYQENSGNSSAPRNFGFQYCSGEYVNFFDADDVMLPCKISNQLAVLIHHQDVSAVCCDYVNFSVKGDFSFTHFSECTNIQGAIKLKNICAECNAFIFENNDLLHIICTENFTINSSTLFRKKFLKATPFSTELWGSEDWLLHFELFSRFYVGVVNQVGFRRRLHDNNKTNNIERILFYKAKSREIASSFVNDDVLKIKLNNFSSSYYALLSKEIATQSFFMAFFYLLKSYKIGNNSLFFYVKLYVFILIKRLYNFKKYYVNKNY
jgi:glycosyltransferase involved in cell wall biosynthesis